MLSLQTPEAVIQRGHDARALIAHPTFLNVVDELSHYHLAGIVAAPPNESGREARDYHHLMHYALNEIAAELSQRVQTADELLLKTKQSEELDDE